MIVSKDLLYFCFNMKVHNTMNEFKNLNSLHLEFRITSPLNAFPFFFFPINSFITKSCLNVCLCEQRAKPFSLDQRRARTIFQTKQFFR